MAVWAIERQERTKLEFEDKAYKALSSYLKLLEQSKEILKSKGN